MSAISSKALLKTTDPYKYNAGSELEEELGYYNTFYRKYDAQIGRFTGVDILAESTAGLSPFQFGNNNPIMFNDPTGAKFERTLTSSGQSFVALFEHWYETGIENAMEGKYKAYNPENIPDDGGGGGQAGNGFFGSGWGYGDLHNTYFNNGGNDAEVTGVMPTVTIEATRQNNGTLSFGDAQWNWNGGRMGSDGWSALPSFGSHIQNANFIDGNDAQPNQQRDGFNINSAIMALNKNSLFKSTGYCARYVRYAIEAGGINTAGRPGSAKDYDTFLAGKGFNVISSLNYQPVAGDIAVMESFMGAIKYHPHGHIQMYNGTKWISDFRQNGFWPGADYRNFQPDFKILRW